jgi:hypothetical protein
LQRLPEPPAQPELQELLLPSGLWLPVQQVS